MNIRHSLIFTLLSAISIFYTQGQSTTNPVQHIRPNWSYNGKMMAYLSDETGVYQLYITGFDPINPVNITPDADNITQYQWSPVANKILYTTEVALYLVSADGTQEKLITNFHEAPFFFNWGSKGDVIYFNCQYREEMKTLCQYHLSVGKERKLLGEEWNIRNFSVSSDGKKLAFGTFQQGNIDIFVYDFSTRQTNKMVDLNFHAIDPVYANNHPYLVFIADRDGRNQQFDVYINEGEELNSRQISDLNGYNLPVWYPDDKQLLINTNQGGDWEVYKINRDGTNQEKLANGIAFSISPVNNDVLLQSDEAGNYQIFLLDAKGQKSLLSDRLINH